MIHLFLLAFVPVEANPGLLSQPCALSHKLERCPQPRQARLASPALHKNRFQGTRDVRGNVNADLVEQFERPHRHAEATHGMIDARHSHPLAGQQHRFSQARHQNPVDDEPRAILDQDGRLAQGNSPAAKVCQHRFSSRRRADYFDQRHLVYWIEKVQSGQALGMLQVLLNLSNQQGRGVRAKHRSRTRALLELTEDGLLDLQVFADRLHGQLDRAKDLPGRRCLD